MNRSQTSKFIPSPRLSTLTLSPQTISFTEDVVFVVVLSFKGTASYTGTYVDCIFVGSSFSNKSDTSESSAVLPVHLCCDGTSTMNTIPGITFGGTTAERVVCALYSSVKLTCIVCPEDIPSGTMTLHRIRSRSINGFENEYLRTVSFVQNNLQLTITTHLIFAASMETKEELHAKHSHQS